MAAAHQCPLVDICPPPQPQTRGSGLTTAGPLCPEAPPVWSAVTTVAKFPLPLPPCSSWCVPSRLSRGPLHTALSAPLSPHYDVSLLLIHSTKETFRGLSKGHLPRVEPNLKLSCALWLNQFFFILKSSCGFLKNSIHYPPTSH